MTKQRIIEELRWSATEDYLPWIKVNIDAWNAARRWRISTDSMVGLSHDDLRTFLLLVAEALND